MYVKGFAAPEPKAAAERAGQLIKQAAALGEPPEDPLLLFSVLYGLWGTNFVAFSGDVMQNLATQFLQLAEKQGATVPLMIGHRLMGTSLMCTWQIAESRTHYDQAHAFYDPGAHRPLAARFGQDIRVAILSFRSMALSLLGHPEAALADTEQAVRYAREIGQAATLMYALGCASVNHLICRNYVAVNAEADELAAVASEKGAPYWKAMAVLSRGALLASTGDSSNAVQIISSGLAALRSTGATHWGTLLFAILNHSLCRTRPV
jgi:hypothetical protein